LRAPPRDAEAELEHGRLGDVAVGDQALGEFDVTEVEHLHLRLHARRLGALRHDPQMRRRVDEHGLAEIQGRDVERADLGLQRLDMAHALLGVASVVPGPADLRDPPRRAKSVRPSRWSG
jgi:hypothetical protein